MNAHLLYLDDIDVSEEDKDSYKVYTVLMTNLGFYVIDDEDESWDQDPNDLEERLKELKEAREERGDERPKIVECFRYDQIKRVTETYNAP